MGIISNIKNRYRVNKNALWFINIGFILATSIISLLSAFCFVFFFGDKVEFLASAVVLILSVLLNVISIFSNRRFINTPIEVIAAVGILLSAIVLFIYAKGSYKYAALLLVVTLVIDIVVIILQWNIRKDKDSEGSLVKIAKVKLDFDFVPEDVIEDYRIALKNIEEKYDMGNKDREAFEKEKSELLADTHQILKVFVSNTDVSVLDKLKTLQMAKTECIIVEDNYLLWKNQILKDEEQTQALRAETEQLRKNKVISQEEYLYRCELLKDEF
ncbi:MAG: hypothetical protein IJV39_06495 [Ruminococcus sp.]|nr:hypothetical protein [Ruminococcus sp.]